MVSQPFEQDSRQRPASAPAGRNTPWVKAVNGVLWLALIMMVGRGLMLLSGDVFPAASVTGGGVAAPEPVPVDMDRLRAGSFFGVPTPGENSAGDAVVEAAENRPPEAGETSLRLTLEGVVAGTSPQSGIAMIASNNRTATYQIGDRLPAGSRVVLDSIYADRVIIDNSGSRETLWLYDVDGRAEPASRVSAGNRNSAGAKPALDISDIRKATSGSYDPVALVNAYREKFANGSLGADFLTLSEIVRISPEYNNSQLVGYRLSPGEHLKEFVRLGFRTNDIATRINGIELNNIANLQPLFEEMTTARDVTVTLLRDGSPVSLALSLESLPR